MLTPGSSAALSHCLLALLLYATVNQQTLIKCLLFAGEQGADL